VTQRSILAGLQPKVVIKAGANVSVRGHASDQVVAETNGKWGLSVERRAQSEVARARAAIGDQVLFDLRLKLPGDKASVEVVEVKITGSGAVLVPLRAKVVVYAGKDIEVRGVEGQVEAYAGHALTVRAVRTLGHVSAGRAMDVDCQSLSGADKVFQAGGDLRFHVADLTSARLRVKDIGGYWEARLGTGEKSIYLKSGGDAILVTDQPVEALPPNFILGRIEKPAPLAIDP
jgi:hypothetical protein